MASASVQEHFAPESKKQKVEQDSSSEDGEADCDSDDDLSDFGNDVNLRADYRRMCQQFDESEGFDVDVHYKGFLIGGCAPVDLTQDNNRTRSLDLCARQAVVDWNQDNQDVQLEFSRVLKAVYIESRGHLFNITLEAKDVSNEEMKVFQAKVMNDFIVDKIKVLLFRTKPV